MTGHIPVEAASRGAALAVAVMTAAEIGQVMGQWGVSHLRRKAHPPRRICLAVTSVYALLAGTGALVAWILFGGLAVPMNVRPILAAAYAIVWWRLLNPLSAWKRRNGINGFFEGIGKCFVRDTTELTGRGPAVRRFFGTGEHAGKALLFPVVVVVATLIINGKLEQRALSHTITHLVTTTSTANSGLVSPGSTTPAPGTRTLHFQCTPAAVKQRLARGAAPARTNDLIVGAWTRLGGWLLGCPESAAVAWGPLWIVPLSADGQASPAFVVVEGDDTAVVLDDMTSLMWPRLDDISYVYDRYKLEPIGTYQFVNLNNGACELFEHVWSHDPIRVPPSVLRIAADQAEEHGTLFFVSGPTEPSVNTTYTVQLFSLESGVVTYTKRAFKVIYKTSNHGFATFRGISVADALHVDAAILTQMSKVAGLDAR
ncbi:MAG: hypothetical protein ACJ735_05865 [Actinomycetes bacterium]